jgi:two-component system, NarL family, sensor kinase
MDHFMEIPESILAEPAYAVLIGIFFVFFMATLLIIFLLFYQKKLLQARRKADQLEKDRQKELIDAGILAQEQDRKRMANDLHDGFGGTLSAIKLFVGKLEPNMPEEKFVRFQDKAIHTLDENITELRGIINDLLPQSLEDEGLIPAIKGMTHQLGSLKDIQVHLHIENERRFAEDKEKAVFRILQELINNATKYSEAKNLNIDFLFGESQLKICYREDGPGFDPGILQNEGRPRSFGFKSIASRMAYLDGHFEANTAPREGFQVHLSIPLATSSPMK